MNRWSKRGEIKLKQKEEINNNSNNNNNNSNKAIAWSQHSETNYEQRDSCRYSQNKRLRHHKIQSEHTLNELI